jgi:hypothetical protein
VHDAHALSQPQVVHRQHVRAVEDEDQEHLRSPPADAVHPHERLDDFLVVHATEAANGDGAVGEVLGEVDQVSPLLP